MEFGKAFTYVFEDKDWVTKLLIGGLLSLIPIVNLVVLGYTLRVLKNVADGSEQPLPSWDDFGSYFVKGLMVVLGSLVWLIPLIAISTAGTVVSAMAGGDAYASERMSGPLVCCMWSLSCVSGLYGLLMGVVLPAAMTLYAVRDEFAAFFRVGEIVYYVKENLGNYVVALLLIIVASFAAGLGMILCFVGVIFTQFWANLVNSHLLGQVYRYRAQPEVEEPLLPIA